MVSAALLLGLALASPLSHPGATFDAAVQARRAQSCSIPEPAPLEPFRHAGTAHIKLKGAGLDVELPAQRADCGAFWFANPHAGDGLLLATCSAEGYLRVRNDRRTRSLEALRRRAQIEFVAGQTRFTNVAPVVLEVSPDLRRAKLRGVLAGKTRKLAVEVNFDCSN